MSQIQNIPFELQQLDQWVVATGALLPDGKRDKVPLNPRTGQKADPTDRSTWGSFREAMACGYPFIGFVLSKEDPYCIIDLDDPTIEDGRELAEDDPVRIQRQIRHGRILDAFESYSELSQSERGVHIICRASVPKGVRRDKVEIYSSERYMICTGNIHKPLPIADCQALVSMMFAEMNVERPQAELVQIDGRLSDDEVFAMADSAANAHKFRELWNGRWRELREYESQSEADFALLSMLCFYTKDNAQVRRLFRYSALGQRDKATRDDQYIDLALVRIRGRETAPIDFTALLAKHQQTELPLHHHDEGTAAPTASDGTLPGIGADPGDRTLARADEARDPAGVSFPPGFIGELAEYFLATAIRPVPEIALVTAIALTAGIAARTYNVSGSGLNQYLILLARTGSGKEGIAKGIEMMVQAVRPKVPMVDQFIGPGAFASGQALLRVLDKQPCFVSILGEFGLTLQQLCDPRANSAALMLKRVLLDVYAKSGAASCLRPNVYSDTDKNTRLVQAPNITILGEATPESFYDGLDASAIAQGLVPRFSVFEYDGARPPKNEHPFGPPPPALVEKFATLLAIALAGEQNRANCPVMIDAQAQVILDAFDKECDREMAATKSDVNLQLWNRAHFKALKLAALVAVGINPNAPCIDESGAAWAIALTRADIGKLLARFVAGDIGQGDSRMESDLKRAVADLVNMSPAVKAQYQVPERCRALPIVPLGYLRRRLRNLASFRNHRLGSNAALGLTIKAMVEAGELQQIPTAQAAADFGCASPLYVPGPNL